MSNLHNLELEKTLLSGLILHPEVRAEIPYITPLDLSATNRVVLSAIDACLSGDTPFSEFLLIDRLNSLGIRIADTIEPGLYVTALKGLSVGERAVVGIAKQLKNVSIRRSLHETGKRIVRVTEREEGKKAAELIAETTEIFNGQVNLMGANGEDEPEDLFGTVGDFLNHETVYDTRSIALPYKHFVDLYGALDLGVTVICSRMKVGKTTLWLSALRDLAGADKDDNFRALVLDTELTKEENQSRAVSAASGVKEYMIRHKLYRKYPEMVKKVQEAEKLLRPLAGRVVHKFIGGYDMAAIVSMARRWAFKTLRDGKRGVIVFDYLKLLSGADFSGKNPLHLTIGAKMEAMKNLAKELNVPILAFCQANRSGEDTKEGNRLQNTAIIGGSDMIAQFASSVFLLERLGPEERMSLCPDLSIRFTHRLIPMVTRTLGPDNLGKNRLVRYKDGKRERWTDNCILFNFDSFNVSECSEAPTLYDLVERMKVNGIQVQPEVKPSGADAAELL